MSGIIPRGIEDKSGQRDKAEDLHQTEVIYKVRWARRVQGHFSGP